MTPIYQNLYQFINYIPPMDFTIHQYLLNSDPAVLFAAGTVQQAETVLPMMKEILNGKPLKYIFVSHMESDEAGGISVFLKEYPEVTVICSELCARELPGYGYAGKVVAANSKQAVSDGDISLHFFDYPSEVHLQNGIVVYEENSGIFYSADLMLSWGNAGGQIQQADWTDSVNKIDIERVPNPEMLKQLKEDLCAIMPSFVAVGHGFCIACV